jgi:protein gp37
VDAACRELWKIDTWLKEKEQTASVFVMSMGDLFEDRPELAEPRAQFLKAMRWCTQVDFLVLTKRPENIVRMVREVWPDPLDGLPSSWWLGATVENQDLLEERMVDLAAAAHQLADDGRLKTFLSVEPMLGPIKLMEWYTLTPSYAVSLPDWVICGCERLNGNLPGREMNPFSEQHLACDCAALGIPFFLKQFVNTAGRVTTDLEEWPWHPDDARRQFPEDLRRLEEGSHESHEEHEGKTEAGQ